MKRNLTAFVLALMMVLSLSAPVFAYGDEFIPYAETLKSLGLFIGSDKGFELERTATRVELAVMMTRLLGKEGEALNGNYAHPFTDVPVWADKYIGYLYANKIVNGVSETSFGSGSAATLTQYAAYVLRAMGYSEAAGDFVWNTAVDSMANLGIIHASDLSFLTNAGAANRGCVVYMSYFALFAAPKGVTYSLLEALARNGVFSVSQLTSAGARDLYIKAIVDRIDLNNLGNSQQPEPQPQPGEKTVLDSKQIFEKCSNAVFYLEVLDEHNSLLASGSGFFISSSGLALTNFHVIDLASNAFIRLPNGKEYKVQSVLGVDPVNDLALIQIAGSGFEYLELGDSSKVETAQRIYCIGSPLGYENSISDGLVSSASRYYEDVEYIQISAAIASGSSGGALINEYGEVIGVTTAGYDEGSLNLNFAIPINVYNDLVRFSGPRSLKYVLAHVNFGYISVGVQMTETGDNDSAAVQNIENSHTLAGTISSSKDVDFYTVTTTEASDIFVSIVSDTQNAANLKFDVIDSSTSKVIFTSRLVQNDNFSFGEGRVPGAGKYLVKVYTNGGSTMKDVSYELFYSAWTNTENFNREDYWIGFEFEPNNSRDTACFAQNYTYFISSFHNASDRDYYTFTLDQESWIEIYIETLKYLDSTGSNSDVLRVEILNADGVKVAEESGNDVIFFWDDLPAGTYYLNVYLSSNVIVTEPEFYIIDFCWEYPS